MKNSNIRIAAGVLVGFAVIIGGIWALSKTLGNGRQWLFEGKPGDYYAQQLKGRDAAASNAAFTVINKEALPQLVDTMLHDTRDSAMRLWLIDLLNGLPGVEIQYMTADGRRAEAASEIGEFGAAAKAAIPQLLQTSTPAGGVMGVRSPAIASLGKIHSEPERVIPILISYLDDEAVDDEAATALGNFGNLAKAAVPKLTLLLKAKDDDVRNAARLALKKIDPVAAAKAGIK